jgi:hypothetical protein
VVASIIVGTDEGIHTVGEPPAPPLEGTPVSALAHRGRSIWAICGDTALKRSVRGRPWEDVVSLPLQAECLLAISEQVALAGTAEAHLFPL